MAETGAIGFLIVIMLSVVGYIVASTMIDDNNVTGGMWTIALMFFSIIAVFAGIAAATSFWRN